MPGPSGLDPSDKASLRRAALARRDELDGAFRAAASLRIGARALRLPALATGPVAAYWPIRSEVDCRPLMQTLSARGVALCLPVVVPPGLIFRAWSPGDPLEAGGFGTRIPPATAPEVAPMTLIVPLAVFDRRGGRIGYGKGYYDRAIARLLALGPVAAIGVAFACQEADAVPVVGHDRRLDLVVTEGELIAGAAPAPGT